MDKVKMGKFIGELRRAKHLTQTQLADKISVERETVSKWERGVNSVCVDYLIPLSETLDISVNELLYGERINDNNREEIERITVSLYDGNLKKRKFIIALIVLFLIYYFLSTFNTLKVYYISYVTNDIKIPNGTLVLTKEKAKFNLGNVETKKEIKELKLFYKDVNNINQFIYNTSDKELSFTVFNGSTEYFDFKEIERIISNLYLEVYFDNASEIIKLDVVKNFSNNYFFPKKIIGGKLKDTSVIDYDKNLEDKIIEKFTNISDGVYEYNFEEKQFTYFQDALNLILNVKEKDVLYTWIYCLSSKNISYQESQNDKILNSFDYVDNKIKCNIKTCKNEKEKINFFKESLDKIFD